MMNRYIFTLLMSVMLLPSFLIAQEKNDDKNLTFISIEEDSLLAGFSIGDSITFNPSFDSICGGFRERIIESGTKNIMYEAFNSVRNDSGEWVLKFYDDVVLEKGHTYTLEIEGHEVADSRSKAIGKVSVIYRGNGDKKPDDGDDYEYSNIKYFGFSLKDGEELTSYRISGVSIQFTGEVEFDEERSAIIDEDGNEWAFQKIEFQDVLLPEYWYKFDIPVELMLQSTSHITLRIYAHDKTGRALKGNREKGENSYYELTYKCELGYPVLSVSPNSGKYKALKEFTFTNEDGIEMLNGENEIQLLTDNGEKVASFTASEMTPTADNSSFTYTLENEVDAIGNYTLIVPEGTFALGSKKKNNKKTFVEYEIGSKFQRYGLESLYPEDGSEVEKLSRIVITFDDIAMPEDLTQQKITVTDSNNVVVTNAKAIFDANRENYKQCIIVLDRTITTMGVYHVNIPAKAFSLGKWGDKSSVEMTFDYTVVGMKYTIGDVTIQTIANEDKMLGRIAVNFNKFSSVYVAGLSGDENLEVTLTDSLNNETKAGLRLGQLYNQLFVENFESPLSAGKYWLHLPGNKLIMDGLIYPDELVLEIDFDPVYDIIVETEEGTEQKLESVGLIFKNYKVVGLKDGRNISYYEVTVTDTQNNVIATAQISKGYRMDNLLRVDNIQVVDELKEELGEKLGEGTYRVHVPAGTIVFDGETYDKEFVYEFSFAPLETDRQIAETMKHKGHIRVYSAQGMLSRDVTDPDKALQGLRRGIYIINGRKVLIK